MQSSDQQSSHKKKFKRRNSNQGRIPHVQMVPIAPQQYYQQPFYPQQQQSIQNIIQQEPVMQKVPPQREIKTFTFGGKTLKYKSGEVEVCNSDTVKVVFEVEGIPYKHLLRLRSIDSVESKINQQKIDTLTPQQQQALLGRKDKALAFTKNILKMHSCVIKTGNFDKFGHILAELYIEGDQNRSLSTILLNSKLVFPYNGGTKLSLEQQADFCINTPVDDAILLQALNIV